MKDEEELLSLQGRPSTAGPVLGQSRAEMPEPPSPAHFEHCIPSTDYLLW